MADRYTDEKGRERFHSNDRVAELVKQFGDYLVIGGYDETHAARYGRLAYAISRYPEPIGDVLKEDRLQELPGVGDIIEQVLAELIETGDSTKRIEFERDSGTPASVVELTAVDGLGVKTAKRLYQEHGIDSFAALRRALEEGRLDGVEGVGPKLRETIRNHRPAAARDD